MDNIDPVISMVITKIDELIANHGTEAWETVLMITRLEGLMIIGVGWLCFLFAAALFLYWKNETDVHYDDRSWAGVLGLIFSVVGIGFNLALWQWVAIFSPELKIASDILWKVLK